MSFVIAVAGKGGTGKTTTSALIIRTLMKMGKTPILAIDADPNSNLAESIGINIDETIGSVLQEFLRNRGQIPQGMSKQSFLDLKLHQILKEGKNLDMMAMGCPEGPGCYCSINAMLKTYFEDLVKNYKYVVIDNEAGMEHFSRKTANDIDLLLFCSNYSLKGLQTVKRLSEMIDEIGIVVSKRFLMVNRTPEQLNGDFMAEVEKIGIPYLGNVVSDTTLEEFELSGRPLTDLPDNSPSVIQFEKLVKNLI